MEGRSFLRDLGEFAQYLDANNQRARAQQMQQRSQQQRMQQQNQERQREQMQRQQQQRQQQQQQQQKKQEKEGGGFGYFMAALVGVAAGFIAKSFFSEEETPKPQRVEEQPNYQRQNPNMYSEPRPTDPVDAELEECNDLVCPITLGNILL